MGRDMPMVTDQQFLLFGALERQCSLSCEVILTIVPAFD